MIKIFPYFFLLVALSFSAACNKSANKTVEASHGIMAGELTFPLSIQKGGNFKEVDQIRVQARTVIDYRIEQEPKPLSMFTYAYWWPEFVFNTGEISAENTYEGYWLKFNEDFSYEYGRYGRSFGSGRYHFRLDDKSLLMLDDDVEQEPKAWQANHNGAAMALVGSHEYGVNNGIQMKLIPLDEKPTK